MKEGDIVIYKGRDYPHRFGMRSKIIGLYDTYGGNRIWNLEFEDEFTHICMESRLELDGNEKKIKNPDIDPFGEEIWGNIKESFIYDEDIAIYVKNKREYDDLMKRLEMDGFLWSSGSKPTAGLGYSKLKEVLVLNLTKRGEIKYSNLEHYEKNFKYKYKDRNYKLINYEEISDKKYKKLKKLEIDPFEEEEWGYVQESFFEKKFNNFLKKLKY